MAFKLLQVFSWVQRWPNGAEDKAKALTGTLMKCQENFFNPVLLHGRWGFDSDAGSCNCSPCLRKMIAGVFLRIQHMWYHMLRVGSSSSRTCFKTRNSINTTTFGQPWKKCAINVTDSFAGSSRLVLSHICITVWGPCPRAFSWEGCCCFSCFVFLMIQNTYLKIQPYNFSNKTYDNGTFRNVWK